jgi:hypothetical protein
MDRDLQSDAGDEIADAPRLADRPLSQEEALARALAAILNAYPRKCAVLEARHLPEDMSGFTTDVI